MPGIGGIGPSFERRPRPWRAGHVVLNPATLPDGLADGDYMRIALAMLEASDLAVFLPDYQESRGAMVEWAWCQRTGKECALYLDIAGGGKG